MTARVPDGEQPVGGEGPDLIDAMNGPLGRTPKSVRRFTARLSPAEPTVDGLAELEALRAERDRWRHATEVLDEALTEARSKLARVAALRRLAGDGVISSDALAYALDGD